MIRRRRRRRKRRKRRRRGRRKRRKRRKRRRTKEEVIYSKTTKSSLQQSKIKQKYLNNRTCYNKIDCTILFSSKW